MRPLKFRTWDEKLKKFHFWGFPGDDGTFIGPPAGSGPKGWPQEQFTGLLDKNGSEIYEGDIVEHVPVGWIGGDGRRGVTGWSPSQGVIVNNWPLGLGVEVIGNIHQNSDLLESKVVAPKGEGK